MGSRWKNEAAAVSGVRVAVVQLAVPAYREEFFRTLQDWLPSVQLAAGEVYFDPTIATAFLSFAVNAPLT